MSSRILDQLSTFFGKEHRSDCFVVFHKVREEPARRPKKKRTTGAGPSGAEQLEVLGEPLPAHLVVLSCGSERFRAQADRWTEDKPGGGKVELRVPLNGEEELPHALSAVRFIYTGKLDGVSGAAALLRVRRLAAYLQVEGCMEPCDEALVALVKATPSVQGAGPLGGVAELHAARELLSEDGNVAQRLLHECRQQLEQYSAAALPAGSGSLGGVLGWAFGGAPSVLSDPATCRQMESLSAAAMEALLGSETFATDSEDTVLLMLAVWLQAHPNTSNATKLRLCKLIRLSQLSSTYLHVILPVLSWFPISAEEHRFLCQYVHITEAQRDRLKVTAKYDFSSAWYAAAARQKPPCDSMRTYEWSVPQADLNTELAKNAGRFWLDGKFSNGALRLYAHGFDWHPSVCSQTASDVAGVYLFCNLPTTLRIPHSVNTTCVAAMSPGPARLVVHKWRQEGGGGSGSGVDSGSSSSAGREEAWSLDYVAEYVVVGRGWGNEKALTLAAPGSAASALSGALRPWAAYLHDGKISGVLTWKG